MDVVSGTIVLAAGASVALIASGLPEDILKSRRKRIKHRKQIEQAEEERAEAAEQQWRHQEAEKQKAKRRRIEEAAELKNRAKRAKRQALLREIEERKKVEAVNGSADLSDPPRHSLPSGMELQPTILGLRESATIRGPSGNETTMAALLDTGNSARTLIPRSLAESLSLVDDCGCPWMMPISTVNFETVFGIGGATRCVVVPRVTFSVREITITSDVDVQLEPTTATFQNEVVISMNDIRKLEALGAEFRP